MKSDIKTTIVCVGKFHLFALARELIKNNMLKCIFTGYPEWKLLDEEIPKEFIHTFSWFQTPYMALNRLRLFRDNRFQQKLAWFANVTLDRHVAVHLPESDVLFALSGSGLYCGREAQKKGMKYICDRGSSHIRYQNNILSQEYDRWGDSFPEIDSRIIRKEEAEYEEADIVTVPSSFAYQSFIEMGVPKRKLRKVPYGVDLYRFEKISDPDPKTFDVLFVGSVCFRKGVPYLLEAFRRLRHPKKRLRVVGGMGPEMARYLKRYPPPANVEFLGHIDQTRLKYIMSSSHVMVLPSIEEGLALVQAQALACGCPVIGTQNSGAKDLFSDGKEGFIVPIRNSVAIAEKLQLLADDPDRRSVMSIAAIEKIKELGGWKHYGKRIVEILTSLC